jgi:hypothetical protein
VRDAGCEELLVLFPIRIDDEVMQYEPSVSGGCTILKIQ